MVLAASLSIASHAGREAAAAGLEDAVKMVESGIEKLRTHVVRPRGAVVAVKDGLVYLSNETGARVAEGRVLEIVRETETITHPVTGEKLGTIEEEAGSVRVVSADDRLITARAAEKGAIREGDRIKTGPAPGPRVIVAPAFAIDPGAAAALAEKVRAVVEKWEGVQTVSPYTVERFLRDEGMGGYPALAESSRFPALKERLGADYLILAEITEEEDALLMDASLFALGDGRMIASTKGLAKRSAAAATPAAPQPPIEKRPLEKTVERPSARAGGGPSSGVKAKMLRRFDGSISAIAASDLDGDGGKEVILGFDGKVAILRLDGERLEPSWEKELGRGFQVTGLQTADVDGDGAPEIYVNSILADRISSFVFERGPGGEYAMTREGLNYLFYAGEDGRLYGQRQNADNSLEQKILALRLDGGSLSPEPFLDIPDKSRLSGILVLDIDGDGAMDAAGIDYQHNLVYYSSKTGDWVKTPGEYGGSNMTITIAGIGDVDTYHQLQPALAALPGAGGYKSLLAVKNEARVHFVSSETFTRSQAAVLARDGMAYYEKATTPKTSGVINGAAVLSPENPALALIARSQTAFFGPDKSEIFLVNLDLY